MIASKLLLTTSFTLLCGIACPAYAQVCKSNPSQASALASLLAQSPKAPSRERFLGALEGLDNAKATFTALEVTDPSHPDAVVQGLQIRLEDGVRNATIYIDDEYYGAHNFRDYFEEVARITAEDIEERMQHPKAPESVSGVDLGLNNRRFSGGPVLNIGWDRLDNGSFTVHFYTPACGNFFFPANAFSKLVHIFLAASDFVKKVAPQEGQQ